METLAIPYINILLGSFTVLVAALFGLMFSDWLTERKSQKSAVDAAPSINNVAPLKRLEQSVAVRRPALAINTQTAKAA